MAKRKDFGKRVKFTIEGVINSEGELNYSIVKTFDDGLIPACTLAAGTVEYLPDVPKVGDIWKRKNGREFRILFVSPQNKVVFEDLNTGVEGVSNHTEPNFHKYYEKVLTHVS